MAWADAAEGADAAIQRILLQRLQAQHYADAQRQQQFENTRQLGADKRSQQQIDQAGELTRMQREQTAANIQSEIEQRKASAGEKQIADARAGRETFSPGQVVDANAPNSPVSGWEKAGVQIGTAIPPVAPRLYTSPEDTQGTPGRTSGRAGYLLTPTPTQKKEQAAEDEKAAGLKRETARDASTQAYQQGMLGVAQQNANTTAAKEPTAHFSVQQTYDETGKPNGLVRVNTLTGEVTPTDGGNIKPPPGAAQAAQLTSAKKEALGSLDQLDQAIEAASGLIGPGAGRVSSIQQMVGNTDPRISALGTKMLLAKMQVDHAASGTVRAGASPQILSRWDNILGNNQTPEGLKAAVQAMREILGGGATAPTVTRKRYNPATGAIE